MPNWDLAYVVERVSVGPHTLNEGNTRGRLDEAMADDTEFHSTQHDAQKNARKASHLMDTETIVLHIGGQETPSLQQRC